VADRYYWAQYPNLTEIRVVLNNEPVAPSSKAWAGQMVIHFMDDYTLQLRAGPYKVVVGHQSNVNSSCHLSFNAAFTPTSPAQLPTGRPHGILGQTFWNNGNFSSNTDEEGGSYLVGSWKDYIVKTKGSVFSTNFTYNLFVNATDRNPSRVESFPIPF